MASQLAALEKAAEGLGLVVAAEHRYVDEGYWGRTSPSSMPSPSPAVFAVCVLMIDVFARARCGGRRRVLAYARTGSPPP